MSESQPQFPDGPPVPMLVEGILTAEQLDQLLRDLQAHAQIGDVLDKQAPQAHSSESPLDVTTAINRLKEGTSRAIQIRYLFDHQEWSDTLFRVPQGFRLVRCQHAKME